ncbi:peptidylprolyl isomerase [Pontiellaceae bacterium B1224]|nr:peptidylprolyl isomerase [Pontiellaceae bacterium B1224]
MFENLVNKKMTMILPVAAAIFISACKEDEAIASTPEPVDLAATEDLFAEPVQANPLTSDPTAVIVRVNGEDITRGEVLEMMNVAMQQLAGRVSPQQMPQIQGQMYEQIKSDLITKKLIDAAVATANVEISDAEVTEAIDQIKTRIPAGQTLEAALASQGTSMEELTENIKLDMATRKFLETKTVGIEDATEAEAKEFYDANPDNFVKEESVSASHILIKTEGATNDVQKAELKAEIEGIRAQIIAGEITFQDAAKSHSGCPSSAQGGSLGTFGKGQMVPEFEVAAFTQEIDEVGDVVETQFGYHIILVTDRIEEGVVPFDEAKEQIIAYLSGQKKQEAVQAFITSLRDSATIEEIAM